MIDFIKIRLKDIELREQLLNDQRLTFRHQRGKLVSDKFKDFVFKICDSGSIEITGSLHKHFNDGIHNWNDFNRVDLWDTVYNVCNWLQIGPSTAELHNLEFGVNLIVPFNPKSLLTDLIAYKGKIFAKVSLPKQGTYYQAETSDYFLKCYDKSAQFGREDHLLRLEVKVKVMRCLNEIGIHSLQDLQDSKKLLRLGDFLVRAWDCVLIREKLPEKELTSKETRVKDIATNTSQYQNLDRRKRHEIRRQYEELIERCARPSTTFINRKQIIGDLARSKWNELINQDVCSNLQHVPLHPREGRLLHSGIVCKRPDSRTCKITGISIAHQRPESVFLSQKTFKEYPQELSQLNLHFRQNARRQNQPDEYYKAKNLRNMDSNPRNNLRRRLRRLYNQPSLFRPDEIIRLTIEQRRLLKHCDTTSAYPK